MTRNTSNKFNQKSYEHQLFRMLSYTVVLSSCISMGFLFDSFTASKLWALSIGLLLIGTSLILNQKIRFPNYLPLKLYVLILLFLFFLVLSNILNEVPFLRASFGQFGRGNGVFYYLFGMIVLVLSSKLYTSEQNAKFLTRVIESTAWFLSVYAFLQFNGIDFAQLNEVGLSKVVLTFGNSNFAGGMLAVLFAILITQTLLSSNFKISRTILLFNLLIATYFTGAVQGYLIELFAIIAALTFLARQKFQNPKVNFALFFGWFSGIVLIFLGLLGKTPLAVIFERQTFQIRIEYWKITSRIIGDHLLVGVGSDGLYNVSSPYMAPGQLDLITTTRLDAAHNWYLNIAANFGVPALLAFIGINLIVLVISGKEIVRDKSISPLYIAIFVGYCAVVLDALVSIEQPGLGIWLYFLGGVLLAVKRRKDHEESKVVLMNTRPQESKNGYQLALSCLLTAVLAITSIQTSLRLFQDAQLRSSIQKSMSSNNVEQSVFQEITNRSLPLRSEPEYIVQSLRKLAQIGDAESLERISKAAYEYNPRSIQATLIRADVLSALGNSVSSCKLREVLIDNEPWSHIQLSKYLWCHAIGHKDAKTKERVLAASKYFYLTQLPRIDVSTTNMDTLSGAVNEYAISARLQLLLGNKTRAISEKLLALSFIQRLEIQEDLYYYSTDKRPDRQEQIDLLNF